MQTTENFKKYLEKCNKRGKLGRGSITYDSPCRKDGKFKSLVQSLKNFDNPEKHMTVMDIHFRSEKIEQLFLSIIDAVIWHQ